MAMGAVPITSRYASSVLPELTSKFDLGPPGRPGAIKSDPSWLNEWTQAVIHAVGMDLTKHRWVGGIRRMECVLNVAPDAHTHTSPGLPCCTRACSRLPSHM